MAPFFANQAMQIGAVRTGGPLHEIASNYSIAALHKKSMKSE